MKRICLVLMLIFASFILISCGVYSGTGGPYPGRLDSDDAYAPENGEGEQENQIPDPGQLTAAEWSDIDNYDFYKGLFTTDQDNNKGIFVDFLKHGYFDTLNMVSVTVTSGDDIVVGATVKLISDTQSVLYQSVTNAFGMAYLFPQEDQLSYIQQLNVSHDEANVLIDYTYSIENHDLEIDLETESDKKEIIEIMFVIDTTGSMGDEIAYLKSEIDNVITRVKASLSNTEIRLALLFYRDEGDDYVTRYFDFTTNIESQKNNLANQSATGGGDFEEAVDQALHEAVNKNWSTENTTKLLIHVLDAPPHNNQIKLSKYFNAINTAAQKGIRMIPVASSGIDKWTEYLLRNEAMMTGGTYVFLTNDSGIGEDHLEASVGETVIEYLNLLLVRVITEYHTGVKLEKIPYYNQNQ